MEFLADKQTLLDLNVLGKYKTGSLFSLFNHVVTSGGERLLDEMFRHPLTDVTAINSRSSVFHYFQRMELQLPFDEAAFSKAEQFLLNGCDDKWFFFLFRTGRRKLWSLMRLNNDAEEFDEGLRAALQVLGQLALFFQEMQQDQRNPLYAKASEYLAMLHANGIADHELTNSTVKGLGAELKYDYLLRGKLYRKMQSLLEFVYLLDVAAAVGKVACSNKLVFARALGSESSVLEISNCRHPALEKAIGNDLNLNEGQNIFFLTGANMAGKSTFMKSVGAAFYLAHMGFPVAADSMRFSVKKGIYSSINVPDDLQQGISHFYAEVLRVKQVAGSVCSRLPLLVIFDELFKGTNVKDAYDATLAVTAAFANYRQCDFIISTHIIEVGEALKHVQPNMQFGFMPTVMKGSIPGYTYRMKEGITEDRHGMMIIRNEGILDIL
ncbi:MutS-related protein [Pseudobacter ginsenosidimutans]|uniref:MutS-like protein n=1 Tax=Pseudobacter ginsenosidimutans TaxID=661488 RepID=A0A4Q7MQC6_9BACT|nr:DNA mismatch repair protein [Pseudobacter ginsenosidimutans]QEC42235.1 DNA mismatch repair protein [Pseudobacter ginsenosidimutans]RZS70922.1 MutS-like protein [Pseudobacter ginsenosidimutans]